ncbi:MAG: hypothetical protein Q8Q60_02375 [Candidatus Chromulinivorax sp.]|nr:hypothetical protein [Candidatus Chromulinivorax sp.]
MNDQKLIKKILNLAYYDFSNNFTRWLSISGLYAIIIAILFCGLCFVTSDYTAMYWGWAPNIILDWTSKLYGLILGDTPTWMLGLMSIVVITSLMLLPMIIIQNALDLAFDSSMRGFSLQGSIFSYIGAMVASNSLLLCSMQLISSIFIFIMLYLMQTSFGIYAFVIQSCMLCMSFLIVYYIQVTYLLSMHILEYKKGIWESCKEVFAMISGKVLFLSEILLLQCFIAACVCVMLYFCLGAVITIIMPIILWFFDTLQLTVQPLLMQMMFNFFYAWSYILLYAWMCLVLAHVYRQLVCPPVDNISCPSCTSCEK